MRQRPPYTPFSTQFRGGKRAIKARLESLFAAPRHRGNVLAVAALLLVVLAGALVACTQASPLPAPSPSSTPAPTEDGSPSPVRALAQAYADEKISAYALQSDGQTIRSFTEAQVSSLTEEERFPDLLSGTEVLVYAMEYRLRLTDAAMSDKVAGGAWVDEEGWFHPEEFSYLIAIKQGEDYSLLDYYSVIDLSPESMGGWEAIIGEMLMEKGADTGDQAMVRSGQLAFARGWLGRTDELVAAFSGRAQQQGEPYTDDLDRLWYRFKNYQDTGLKRLDDAILSAAYGILDHDVAVALFNRYVYNDNPMIRQFGDSLYFRADSADLLLWDYGDLDLSTLTVTYADDNIFQFYVLNKSGEWTARFTMTRTEGGGWTFCQFYDFFSQDSALWDFSFTLDGVRHFMGEEGSNLFGTPYATTRDDDLGGEGVYSIQEWYGKGGSTGASYAYSPDRGTLVLRGVNTRDDENLVTWRGIRLGSTMEEVKAAYPDTALFSDAANLPREEYRDFKLQLNLYDQGQFTLSFYDHNEDGILDDIIISDTRY